MKRLQWTTLALMALISGAYADNIPTFDITSVTVLVGPGSDNVFFTLSGPGNLITGDAGLNCQELWCGGQFFPPGSTVPAHFGFGGQIFFEDFPIARLGGQNYNGQTLGFDFWSLNTFGDVTLPNGGGSTFTTCGGAAVSSPVSGLIGAGPSFTNFTLQMPSSGQFCSTWDFNSFAGGYTFDLGRFTAGSASSVPEPGTLGLLLAGLAGLFAVCRRGGRSGASEFPSAPPCGVGS